MNRTTEAIAIMMAPMSPICFAKLSMNPFSVVVFVSAGELANLVEGPAQRHRLRGVAIFTTYHDQAFALGAVLVEIVVPERRTGLVDASSPS